MALRRTLNDEQAIVQAIEIRKRIDHQWRYPPPPGEVAKKPVAELLIVRHGTSAWNESKHWQGQSGRPGQVTADGFPNENGLTDNGLEDAKHAGRVLATNAKQIDLIVSSPLTRTVETAEAIQGELAEVNPNGLDRVPAITLVEALAERSLGEWEGHTQAEIIDMDPALYVDFRVREAWTAGLRSRDQVAGTDGSLKSHDRLAELLAAHSAFNDSGVMEVAPPDVAPPGGETEAQVTERVVDALIALANEWTNVESDVPSVQMGQAVAAAALARLVVVTHKGIIDNIQNLANIPADRHPGPAINGSVRRFTLFSDGSLQYVEQVSTGSGDPRHATL